MYVQLWRIAIRASQIYSWINQHFDWLSIVCGNLILHHHTCWGLKRTISSTITNDFLMRELSQRIISTNMCIECKTNWSFFPPSINVNYLHSLKTNWKGLRRWWFYNLAPRRWLRVLGRFITQMTAMRKALERWIIRCCLTCRANETESSRAIFRVTFFFSSYGKKSLAVSTYYTIEPEERVFFLSIKCCCNWS